MSGHSFACMLCCVLAQAQDTHALTSRLRVLLSRHCAPALDNFSRFESMRAKTPATNPAMLVTRLDAHHSGIPSAAVASLVVVLAHGVALHYAQQGEQGVSEWRSHCCFCSPERPASTRSLRHATPSPVQASSRC
ncbi:hypothetical protein COO60DRAFT_1556055 [Scenedesmus sp. NREL 46B-D3]|nr:hypothetical protein COO60DRAFT_1556055 [Scenedesmus sp. NREL 46B-D3]